MTADDVFWFFVNVVLGASAVCAFIGIQGILRRGRRDPVIAGLARESESDRTSREGQEKRDACRNTWKDYDVLLEGQRDAMMAKGPPHALMISMSQADYLWHAHVPHIQMPWRYENRDSRHVIEAPKIIPTLEWGWREVGPGQPTRAAAETLMMRVIAPDTYDYVFDKDGVSQGRIAKPYSEQADDT